MNGLAVPENRARGEIALIVSQRLIELGGKAMFEIVEDVFPRGDVDLNVGPFLGRDFREPSLRQGRAGGDELNHAGVPRLEVGLDRRDQRRRLHRRDQVIEESLLGALERGTRGGFA